MHEKMQKHNFSRTSTSFSALRDHAGPRQVLYKNRYQHHPTQEHQGSERHRGVCVRMANFGGTSIRPIRDASPFSCSNPALCDLYRTAVRRTAYGAVQCTAVHRMRCSAVHRMRCGAVQCTACSASKKGDASSGHRHETLCSFEGCHF